MGIFNKIGWKIFLTFFLSYLLFGQHVDGNQKSLVDLTLAMGFHNKLDIDEYHNSSYITKTFDIAYNNEHYYSDKAIGLPIIGALIIKILKPFFITDPILSKDYIKFYVLIFLLIALTSSLFSALTTVLVYKISRYFTRKDKVRLLIAFTYGFSPLALSYATQYKTHATSTFFAFLCFYLIFKMKKMKHFDVKNIFWAGLAGGFAIITEYTSMIIILICLIMLLFQKKIKPTLIFLIGINLIISLGGLYHFLIYGNPLQLNYFNLVPTWPDVYGDSTLVGLYFKLFQKTSPLFIVQSIIQILFLPFKGLFLYFPILIFSIIGLFFMKKEYKIESLSIGLIFLTILFWNSTRYCWWCHEGLLCRRFLIFVPFLMIPLIYSFKRFNYKLLFSLSTISILVGLLTIQRTDRLGGFVYGIKPTVIKYSYFSLYKIIATPLTNYYLPLFVKFGPSSDVVNKVLGFQIPIFLNLILLISIIYLIWRRKINNWVAKNKKIAYSLFFIFSILIFARIVFDARISTYAEKTYTDYFLDKPVEDYNYNLFNSFFLPHKGKIESIKKKYVFNIPYILKVDPPLTTINEKNKNWYYPTSKPSAKRDHNYMYQNGTISIKSKREVYAFLDLTVRSYYKEKTTQIYFNEELIESFLLDQSPHDISVTLSLKEGINTIRFFVPEGCTLENEKFKYDTTYGLDFSRHIRCKSLDFDKIHIYEI